MKLVILAGGLGSRLSEETQVKPKPLVSVGNMPIIWHIMKIYSHYGINDFVICLGYKGHMIKEFFNSYHLYANDLTVQVGKGVTYHGELAENWNIALVDTGDLTQTGGRLKRVRDYLGDDDFCMTYGDGVANVKIDRLLAFHKSHDAIATVTATHPTARFGALSLNGDTVEAFIEKPVTESSWINGGFFVLNPSVFDYIGGDDTLWEQEPMRNLASDGQLKAFCHDGFWQPMDTLREKTLLEDLWMSGKAPWKVWK